MTLPSVLDSAQPDIAAAADIAEVRGRQQAAVLAFGRRTNARPSLGVLIQDSVALVAEVLKTELGGASQIIGDGRTLSLRIVSSEFDGEPLKPVVHESPLRGEDSMAGYALTMASPIASNDLTAEPRFRDRFLCNLGVRAALTVPLHQNKQPFGTLAVYCRAPREFTNDDLQFAETIAHLLTSSMARVKAEEGLRQQLAFSAGLFDVVESLVVVLGVDGTIADINHACAHATGFTIDEIRARQFVGVFAAPEDVQLFQHTFQDAVRNGAPCKFKSCLCTKDAKRLQVAWSLRVTLDAAGDPCAILLSGIYSEIPATQPFQATSGRRGKDSRTSQRRVFQFRQMIAPVVGVNMPSENDFFAVDCDDISAGGISFYLDRLPDFEKLIVALGKAPDLTHFAAQVVRYVEKVNDGKRRYLVGCRFLGRAHL